MIKVAGVATATAAVAVSCITPRGRNELISYLGCIHNINIVLCWVGKLELCRCHVFEPSALRRKKMSEKAKLPCNGGPLQAHCNGLARKLLGFFSGEEPFKIFVRS
jgi:hypothetical protein